MLAICKFAHFLMPLFGWEVVFRGVFTYNYSGQVFRVSVNGGTGGSGWAYYDSNSGFMSGVVAGWGDALVNFIHFGTCDTNWDIWIDGVQYCKNGSKVKQA